MLRKAVIKLFTQVCYNPSVTLRVPPVSSLDSVGDKRLPPAIIALAQGRLSIAPHSVIILPDKSVFTFMSDQILKVKLIKFNLLFKIQVCIMKADDDTFLSRSCTVRGAEDVWANMLCNR